MFYYYNNNNYNNNRCKCYTCDPSLTCKSNTQTESKSNTQNESESNKQNESESSRGNTIIKRLNVTNDLVFGLSPQVCINVCICKC